MVLNQWSLSTTGICPRLWRMKGAGWTNRLSSIIKTLPTFASENMVIRYKKNFRLTNASWTYNTKVVHVIIIKLKIIIGQNMDNLQWAVDNCLERLRKWRVCPGETGRSRNIPIYSCTQHSKSTCQSLQDISKWLLKSTKWYYDILNHWINAL